jgi:DNA modification methylase
MIIRADARHLPLRDACVQTCVTSPPYFGLRSYPDERQIGLESTPDAYVTTLVQVFREVRRVLKDDGTVWLNLGDSYTSAGGGGEARMIDLGKPSAGTFRSGSVEHGRSGKRPYMEMGAKPKDLLGIPWRVAFALQADGWYLRSDIIWHKPKPMPESVTDRPTKAHEYLFLLTKSARYYYDAEAIREDAAPPGPRNPRASYGGRMPSERRGENGQQPKAMWRQWKSDPDAAVNFGLPVTYTALRNKRSVWTVPTFPYGGAHFAVFPEKLIEPCILAGAPLGGLVLDPFLGSGTTGSVAERLGRRWVGTDLTYQPLSKARTAQRGIRFEDEAEVIDV